MKTDKISSLRAAEFCSSLLAYGLPLLYFLVTVSFYLRTYDSAQIKITLLQIGGTALAVIWVAKLLFDGRWPLSRENIITILPFLAFALSGIVSYIRTPFPGMCLDEFTRRLFYVLMAMIVITEFNTPERLPRLSRWLIAATIVVAVYGLIQYLDGRLFPPKPEPGLDPFIWRQAFGARVFSSFGNPNFYGNFLVLITPFIFAFYLRYGGKPVQPFLIIALVAVSWWLTDKIFIGMYGGVPAGYGFWYKALLFAVVVGMGVVMIKGMPNVMASLCLGLFGLVFLNLLSTETKGAWIGYIGAIAGVSGLTAWYFVGKHATFVKRLIFGLVITVLIAGICLVGFYTKKRMTSVKFRVFTWIAAWEMIQARPVLGSGVGSFKVAYPAYRRPEIITLEGKSNTETDHVEDEYLEVWHDEGIFGLGIFLWLILTVSWCGLKNLKRLTKSSGEDSGFLIQAKPAAYQLLGYLAAFWGALIHWFFDVSIRFVSSGIYVGLLHAGVLAVAGTAAAAENQDNSPMPAPEGLNRGGVKWVKLGWAGFWLIIFLSLKIQPVAAVMCCGLLWLLSEGLDFGLLPEAAKQKDSAGEANGNGELSKTTLLLRWGMAGFVIIAGFAVVNVFRGFFLADVNHNLAIFFSKQAIWMKAPQYDSQAANMGQEMNEEYKRVGGALEHYTLVNKLNPFFPMSLYFIGNVFNDWGSQVEQESQTARSRGDITLAETLRKQAIEHWRKALEAYERTKKLATNYVQTHHQVGLVYSKFAEQAKAWGELKGSEEYYDKALESFAKYRFLDPVFPPNQFRLAAIYIQRRQYKEAEDCYRQVIFYNDEVARRIFPEGFKDRVAEAYLNWGKLNYFRALESGTELIESGRQSLLKQAEDNLRQAVTWQPNYIEAMKALAILLGRMGRAEEAVLHWQKLREIAPQDPDVIAIFGTSTIKRS